MASPRYSGMRLASIRHTIDDRPAFGDDEIEQPQHAVHEQQHRGEAERAEQGHEDELREIAVDLSHRIKVIAPDPKRLQAAPTQF